MSARRPGRFAVQAISSLALTLAGLGLAALAAWLSRA
jgi:hypothetical protein